GDSCWSAVPRCSPAPPARCGWSTRRPVRHGCWPRGWSGWHSPTGRCGAWSGPSPAARRRPTSSGSTGPTSHEGIGAPRSGRLGTVSAMPPDPVTTPPGPGRRRYSPFRSVIIVLCVIVALMVLVVGGLVAWTQLRPVNSSDYSKVGNDASALKDELTPIVTRQSQMMDLSLLPTPEQVDRAA